MYAMKILQKKAIIERNQVEQHDRGRERYWRRSITRS